MKTRFKVYLYQNVAYSCELSIDFERFGYHDIDLIDKEKLHTKL